MTIVSVQSFELFANVIFGRWKTFRISMKQRRCSRRGRKRKRDKLACESNQMVGEEKKTTVKLSTLFHEDIFLWLHHPAMPAAICICAPPAPSSMPNTASLSHKDCNFNVFVYCRVGISFFHSFFCPTKTKKKKNKQILLKLKAFSPRGNTKLCTCLSQGNLIESKISHINSAKTIDFPSKQN